MSISNTYRTLMWLITFRSHSPLFPLVVCVSALAGLCCARRRVVLRSAVSSAAHCLNADNGRLLYVQIKPAAPSLSLNREVALCWVCTACPRSDNHRDTFLHAGESLITLPQLLEHKADVWNFIWCCFEVRLINHILPLVPRGTRHSLMFSPCFYIVCAEKCGKSNSTGVCHVTSHAWLLYTDPCGY